jgi:hypothetical protein
MSDIILIVLGIAMLLIGRKLFWLFVGVVGFYFGYTLAGQFLPAESEVVVLVIGLMAGILGAILAAFLQRIAVGIAGFIAGGYFLASMLTRLGFGIDSPYWLLFIIGGVIGVLLVVVMFDWALILLSSLVGAGLLVQTIDLTGLMATFAFFFLFFLGILLQAKFMRGWR